MPGLIFETKHFPFNNRKFFSYRHRGINLFLPVFSQKWLADEDVDQDRLVADVCVSLK